VKVAFLSDLHANFPALCRALDGARRGGADRIFCAGDLVGLGPHPTEVVRLLMEEGVECILGNADRKVLAAPRKAKKLKKRVRRGKGAGEAWTAMNLGLAERAWLEALPPDRRIEIGGLRVWVVHGSPLSDTDYIFPSITAGGLLGKLGEEGPDVLVCGHSHIPFCRTVAGVRVLNCGSVGRPVDGDPRGAYALCDFPGRRRFGCRIVRFDYPLEALAADLLAREPPGSHPEEWLKGVKPKEP
jgi:putative phosphoesterase